MEWYQWVFSGIGAVAIAALAGGAVWRVTISRGRAVKQRQRSGKNSTNIQTGGDASINLKPKADE